MTTATASLHQPPAGTDRSRRRSTVAPVPANADAMPTTVVESHLEGSAGHQFSMMDGGPPLTTPPSPAPAETAARSNPHRRQTAHQRPAGSFLGGFRTPALTTADRSSRAGIRNPSRKRLFASSNPG